MSKLVSRFFTDRRLITLRPALAEALGSADDAAIVQQVKFWCEINEDARRYETHFIDGHWWTFNSIKEWHKTFSWMSEKTLQRKMKKLRELGVLVTAQFGSSRFDHRLWYRVDHEKLEELYQDGDIYREEDKMTQSEGTVLGNSDKDKMGTPTYTKTSTKNTTENTPATIDDLGSRRNAGIHPPLSTLESFILGSIEAELKTHSLANWVFKVVNGKQVNLDTFKAFCEGVNKDTFIADLQSILANWSNTGFARNNHAPTIGRILSVWNDDSAKASREFEALVVPLQEVIKRDKAEARRMVQTKAYEGIKATMKRNSINFDFVETARKEQWEKLK